MAGNTLFNVFNPVNSQDVFFFLQKDYVDYRSNEGFLKEHGAYHVTGYLNIGFNEIKNVKDPTEIHEVANKSYVDSFGKARVHLCRCCGYRYAGIYFNKSYRSGRLARRCD